MKKIIALIFLVQSLCFSQPVQQVWTARYVCPMQTNWVSGMALDSSQNIVITGLITQTNGRQDYCTIKYNPSGVQQWVSYYDGIPTSNGVNWPKGIGTDLQGNIFVTGFSERAVSGTDDFCTIKYNSSGVQQWVARFDYTGYGISEANGIAIDHNGNIYITGATTDSTPYHNVMFTTIKYNQNGVQQWIRKYGLYGQFGYEAKGGLAITVDDSSNVYVTGNVQGAASPHFTIIKYNTNGVQQWIAEETASNLWGYGTKICVDNSGNVYVLGESSSLYSILIRYNVNGLRQWYNIYQSYHNYPFGLGVDNNNAYVGGISLNINPSYMFAAKFNLNGVQQWLQPNTGAGIFAADNGGLALDDSLNIYITGPSINTFNNLDYTTIKFDNSGNQKWIIKYEGPNNVQDNPIDIKIDNNRNIYVSGNSGPDFLTVKYSQPIGIKNISGEIPNHFSLSQNYPNPFNPSTKINYQIPISGFVNITLYDVLGRKVAELVNEKQNGRTYEVEFDGTNFASGIYFYKLETETFTQTRKMVLMK